MMTVQQRNAAWSLRDLVVVGAIAVVFGFLFLQWVPAWLAVRALGPVAQELMFGFWFVAGILSVGWAAKMPTARTSITPIFMYELR